MIQKIRRWWRWEGKHLHKDIKQGFKNLWKWLPTIWKDRDWDTHFIYELLKKKLEFQSDYIGKRGIHTEAKKDSRNMKICVSLIKKLQDQEYEMEYIGYSEIRHWFEPCKNLPGYSTLEREELSENYDEYFKKYPRIYKRALNGEGIFDITKGDDKNKKKMIAMIAMNISHINHKRARRLLFKIMDENIEGWWD